MIHPYNKAYFIIKFSLAMLCLGYFVLLYRGSDLGSVLFMRLSIEESAALVIEKIIAALIVWFGLIMIVNPNKPVAITLSLLFAILLGLGHIEGGRHFAQWALFSGAAKVAAPWVLYYFSKAKKRAVIGIVKLSASITFATHGLQALSLNPVFLDYILLNPLMISTHQNAEVGLKVVGLLDLLAAFLLLFNYKPAFYWFVAWGFFIALLRLVDGGIYNYPEFLVRAPYFLAVLSLMVIFKKQNPAYSGPLSEFGKIA